MRFDINKPSKILSKTSSVVAYIELDNQNAKAPRTYDLIDKVNPRGR